MSEMWSAYESDLAFVLGRARKFLFPARKLQNQSFRFFLFTLVSQFKNYAFIESAEITTFSIQSRVEPSATKKLWLNNPPKPRNKESGIPSMCTNSLRDRESLHALEILNNTDPYYILVNGTVSHSGFHNRRRDIP